MISQEQVAKSINQLTDFCIAQYNINKSTAEKLNKANARILELEKYLNVNNPYKTETRDAS